MSNLSLSAVSDDTGAFLRREGGLVMTVAFATFGLGLLLVELLTPAAAAGGRVQPGPWMLWVIPAALLGVLGQLTISLLVLTPGASVREAIAGALRRLPTVLVVAVMLGVAGGLAVALFTMVAGVAMVAAGGGLDATTVAVTVFLFAFFLWAMARLLLIWPLIADGQDGPVAAVRRAWRLSKGHAARFGAVVLAFLLLYVVFVGAGRVGFGSLFLLLGKLIGAEGLARFLAAFAVSAIGAALQAVWAVFVTQLYRRASGATSGT